MANYLEQLAGSGGSRNIISIPATSIPAADWEVEFKFRVPAGTTGEINLMGDSANTNNRFYVSFTTGILSFRANGTAYNSAASGITAGVVNIVKYQRVGSVTRFFLNGTQVTQNGFVVALPAAYNLLGGASTTSSRLDLYYAKITTGTINRDWNATGVTSGTEFPELIANEDGTLTNFAGNPWKAEPTFLTLTNPMVAGSAFAGTCEGYADGAATLSNGVLSIAVTVATGAFSGNLPTLADGVDYPFMPAAGSTWTLTQSSSVSTISRDLNLPSGYDVTRDVSTNPSNFASIQNDSTTLQSAFVAASNPLTTNDRAYFLTADGLIVYPDTRIEVGTVPWSGEVLIHRADGNIYFHDVSLTAAGEVVVPPTMPADTSVSVDEGATTLGIFAASSTGGGTVTYSLGGTNAALFSINSSTGLVTFVSPAVVGSASITVTATNSAGSDSQAISVTINAVTPSELESYMGIGIRIGFGI